MRLTNETKERIRKLYKEGKNKLEISKIIGVSHRTVTYWLYDDENRKKAIVNSCNYFKKLPQERKKEIYKKRLPYIRTWLRNKYHTDNEFRLAQIKRVKESKKKEVKKNE